MTHELTTDIAIVGGGLAGSSAAAMLGRAGIDTVLVDPHAVYPPDFRCEKLDDEQLGIFRRTELAKSVLPATIHGTEDWIARFGTLVEKRPSDQYGIRYEDLVNAVRAQIPVGVAFLVGKAVDIANTPDRQTLTLAGGEAISARLIVVANGLNSGLRRRIGLGHEVISPCHSITVGFDMAPVSRPAFPFGALNYFPEKTGRMAYLTVFPVAGAMRANLMTYRQMDDPWLSRVREAPEAALREEMPRLERMIGPFAVVGPVKIRPADLYATTGYLRPGMVVVGDAFGTSCPAAGSGTSKVFTDVERLCNVHIPSWLRTDGMDRDKIAAFYDDPVKRAADQASLTTAFRLRTYSTDRSIRWTAERVARFVARMARAKLRRLGRRARVHSPGPVGYAPAPPKTPEMTR